MKYKIIDEDNHLLVVEKLPNVPVQKDSSNDLDLSTMLKQYLKHKYNKPGNIYLGMVHRLDRPVGGLMVFAKTSKAASRLSEIIRNKQFVKKYLAVVEGKMKEESKTIDHYLIKDKETNISKIVSSSEKEAKKASLSYQVLKYDAKRNLSLIEVNLLTGRHHQIRVQLAGIRHPIYGDQKYNNNSQKGIQIHLYASEIEFLHPVKRKNVKFTCLPEHFIIK